MKIVYKMPIKANAKVLERAGKERGVWGFKDRQEERIEARKRRELIIELRCDWEKERYYGFYKDAAKIADRLRELGYWVDRYDSTSIYGEGKRKR